MNTIIAGRFQQQQAIDDAVDALLRDGVAREAIALFFVNPPGQHNAYRYGGDHHESAGTHTSRKGIVKGAAAGAAVGAAATAFLGPVGAVTGALVGAHVGGLVGGLSQMRERGDTGAHGEDLDNAMPLRESGLMLALALGEEDDENHAIGVLRACGAEDIERAQGTIVNGDWIDFDPVAPPALIAPPPQANTAPQRAL